MLCSLNFHYILQSLCSSNTQFNQVCHNESLWQTKIRNNFSNAIKPSNMSWNDYYLSLAWKPVYYHDENMVC